MAAAAPELDLEWFKHGDYREDYIVSRQLGEGSFGDVKLAQSKASKEMRAIKIIAKEKLQSDKDEEALKQECQILLKYGIHPNICRLYEVYHTPKTVAMVMELVDGGDLFDGIVEAPQGRLTEKFAATVLHRSCSALAFLHKYGVAHRDIKPENLMLMKDLDVDGVLIKLADFGFARLYDSHSATMSTTCGTPEYVAPEVLKQIGYGCECDVWSMGIVTYIMLCGYAPFHHENVQRLFRLVMRGQFTFPQAEWAGISQQAKALIKKMLTVNPAERISAKAILNDAWIHQNVTKNELIACEDPLEHVTPNLARFNAKRKFKAVVRSQMFQSRISASIMERTTTVKVAEQIGIPVEAMASVTEYMTSVEAAVQRADVEGGGQLDVQMHSMQHAFRADEANRLCADTGVRLTTGSTHVSPKHGVFVSADVAAAHAAVGTCKPRPLSSDEWTPAEIARVVAHGNAKQNRHFEALAEQAAAAKASINNAAELEAFVRAKYVDKVFFAGASGVATAVAPTVAEPEPEAAVEPPAASGQLRVQVVRGENLKKMDFFPFTSDPYVRLGIGESMPEPAKTMQTRYISNDLNPQWNDDEVFVFRNVKPEHRLCLECWDHDLGDDDFMGSWKSAPMSTYSEEPCPLAAELARVSHGTIHLTIAYTL
jgi:serine/threonine protein kinase